MPRAVGRLVFHPDHPTQAPVVIVIPGGLFVAESKIPINDNLWDCFPQVIADMYASATKNKCVHSASLRLFPSRFAQG